MKTNKVQWTQMWLIACLCISIIGLSLLSSQAEGQQLTPDALRTLSSLKKIDDFPLYEMRYYGDYDLAPAFQIDGSSASQQSSVRGDQTDWACTCFAALHQESDMIFGRNFDWSRHPALILFTNPPGRYASVSMVDIFYLGFSSDREPSELERRQLLDAPNLPFDGMNEHGLVVGIMSVPSADSGRKPNKTTIGSLGMIRLLLDRAKDVDEALSLFQKYNIDFTGGPPLHYLIADATGKSAVVEFVQGEMSILRNQNPWQISTNFVITGTTPESAKSRCWRYRRASETLTQMKGKLAPKEAMTLLENVSLDRTIWSAVYNLTTGSIQVVMGRKYPQVHEFALRER